MVNLWVDGTYQNTERTEDEASRRTSIPAVGNTAMATVDRDTDVDSAGVGFGTKLTYQGFALLLLVSMVMLV